MLRLDELCCGYGPVRAVDRLSLEVPEGSVFALIGPNGAGKSSTLMSVAGHVAVQGGAIRYRGSDLTRVPVARRAALGIAVVPEGRQIFSDLSVADNLTIGGYTRPRGRARENRRRVLEVFPRLGERLDQRAGSLSGGEQQMLAIARALMADPQLMLIDEMSLGLMPKMVDICYEAIEQLNASGLTILLVEQSTERALRVADNLCVLESGRAVWQGSAAAAGRDPALIEAYLGLRAD